jgi:hypothetical protein
VLYFEEALTLRFLRQPGGASHRFLYADASKGALFAHRCIRELYRKETPRAHTRADQIFPNRIVQNHSQLHLLSEHPHVGHVILSERVTRVSRGLLAFLAEHRMGKKGRINIYLVTSGPRAWIV